ncbi:MAG: hypothetical protein U1E22_00040, partial [Coriobacteriia bacterium]|nr:hypothetical protein [Coriobacteriia bacterium]
TRKSNSETIGIEFALRADASSELNILVTAFRSIIVPQIGNVALISFFPEEWREGTTPQPIG